MNATHGSGANGPGVVATIQGRAKGGSAMVAQFKVNFYDCSEWLAQYFVPWRWFVVFHETTRELRQNIPVQ